VTRQWRAVPTYKENLIQKGETSAAYYRFMNDIHTGNPPSAETSITVTASPFKYTAPMGGSVIIEGGTVSQVTYTRSTTAYVTGQTSGMFPVGAGDILIVTYSGTPTMTFAPL
jgi:hypothetical protein